MRRRIIICLGLLLVLCLLGDAIAMVCLGGSIQKLTHLVDSHRIQSLRAELSADAFRVESDLLHRLIGSPPHVAQRQESLQRFRESSLLCSGCHHEPDIQGDLDAVRASFEAYVTAAGELFRRIERPQDPSNDDSASPVDGYEQVQILADQLVDQTTDLSDRARMHLAGRSADVVASIRNAWIVLSATMFAALIAGGFVAIHLERRLTRPVAHLLEGIERARHGDLTHEFSMDADEEFLTLGRAFGDAHKSLDTARVSVQQAEKMAAMGRLAAGVAHEVGNPLASISAIAQVMQRRCAAGEKVEELGLIMEEVARISRIIRELLAFSRPAAGVSYDPLDISAVLDHATTLLRYDKRAKRVKFVRQYDGVPPVRGDRDQLLLVFTNVIFNAMDALSGRADGSGQITIGASHDDGHVTVRIEDNGSGMSDEERANAFEPFFTTKEPGVGTGLGLWICYQVVQRHKGAIELLGSQGAGTTVVVTLPCHGPGAGHVVAADEHRVKPASTDEIGVC